MLLISENLLLFFPPKLVPGVPNPLQTLSCQWFLLTTAYSCRVLQALAGSLTQAEEAATHPEFRCQPPREENPVLKPFDYMYQHQKSGTFLHTQPGPASSAVSVPASALVLWMPSSGSLTADSDTGGERLALLPPLPLPPPPH